MLGLRSISATFAIAFFVTAGCSLPTLDLRDQIDLHRVSFHDKLIGKETLAKAFLACTRQAHDEPKTALDTLSIDERQSSGFVDRPIRMLIERVQAHRPDETDSLRALQELFADGELLRHRRLDLGKLRRVADTSRQWHAHVDFDEDVLARDTSHFAQLLLAYNKAYFGDVQFIPKPTPPNGGVRSVLKVTSAGFVDRNGNVWVFPGLSVNVQKELGARATVSALSVDSQRVSSDLARVFLEAFFDAAFRVPAIHGATALRVEPNPQESPYPEFDTSHPTIPLEALARVTRDALRAEAAVTSLVGKAVRGGSVFGTQNETLAATLETAAGVIAKKLVEHEGFCYYQVTAG